MLKQVDLQQLTEELEDARDEARSYGVPFSIIHRFTDAIDGVIQLGIERRKKGR